MNLFGPHSPRGAGAAGIPGLQVRKLRQREAKRFSQSPTGAKWRIQPLNRGRRCSAPILSPGSATPASVHSFQPAVTSLFCPQPALLCCSLSAASCLYIPWNSLKLLLRIYLSGHLEWSIVSLCVCLLRHPPADLILKENKCFSLGSRAHSSWAHVGAQ